MTILPPLTVLLGYSLYSFFLAYQKAYLRTLRDAENSTARSALFLFVLAAAIYGLWFLIVWGLRVDWLQVLILLGVSLLIQLAWYPVEKTLQLQDIQHLFGRIGYAVIPVCGYLLWRALP